jgi:acyl-CoA reductase-like NAD-dependent aldehyde dehydrogenase
MTPVTLELGGKDPAVILPETDLNRSISLWMRGVLCVIDCVTATSRRLTSRPL